ncbi:MAG: O-antigen ligase family protein [Thermoleophilaceae bacterium]
MRGRSLLEPLHELRQSAAAIPALVMVAVFVALGAADGGYFETASLPAALFALGLLVVALVSLSTRAGVPKTVAVAVGLTGGYAAWSYLSILWAEDQGAAWEGANVALMYAIVYALFALWPMRGRAAAIVLGAFGLGVAGLGVVTLVRASAAADVSQMFVSGRFVEPLGYVNGNVALWFSGLLPCVFLAARREVWPPLRGLGLGGAGLLAGLALLGQSRGWLVAMPLTLIAFLAIARGRARHGTALAAVAVATLLASRPVLDVFEGIGDGAAPEPLVGGAARAIFAAAAALALIGAAAALADRGVSLGERTARRARAGTAVALALAALVGAGIGVAALGDPVAKASDAWEDFKAGTEPGEEPSGSSRFTSAAGGNRYDFWRVALDEFSERPLIGLGVGNFQGAYLREGESVERPQFSHSLELRLLSETGLVGALLFAGGAGAGLVAGARAIRRRDPLAAAAAGTAIATFLYWVLHGSIDWFYELPALGAPAFAMLGLSASLAPRPRLAEDRRPGSNALVGGRAGVAVLIATALVGAVALAAPWLSELYVNRAVQTWPADPDGAFEALDRAAALNPLSIDPHAAGGAIALRAGRPEEAAERFREVLERDPDDAYATLQLGALVSQLGDGEEAVRLLSRAAELSPQDAIIAETLRAARAGRKVDAVEVYDAVLERRSAITGG